MSQKPTEPWLTQTTSNLSTSKKSSSVPQTLSDGLPLPKMIVFDLDYTLWPFFVYIDVTLPVKFSLDNSSVSDDSGKEFAFYSNVDQIIQSLSEFQSDTISRPILGVASRTSKPEIALAMLHGLHVNGREAFEFFDYMEIYPSDKKQHFEALQEKAAVDHRQMLFFDDEIRNKSVETLGVTMWLVEDGLSGTEFDRGVEEWRKRMGVETTK